MHGPVRGARVEGVACPVTETPGVAIMITVRVLGFCICRVDKLNFQVLLFQFLFLIDINSVTLSHFTETDVTVAKLIVH